MGRELKPYRVILILLCTLVVGCSICLTLLWHYQSPMVTVQELPQVCEVMLKQRMAAPTAKTSNCEARRWYLKMLGDLPAIDDSLKRQAIDLRGRSLCAYSLRRAARIGARAMMASQFDVVGLRLRDILKYGNPDGPSFTYLLGEKEESRDYEKIILSARRVSATANVVCESDAGEG